MKKKLFLVSTLLAVFVSAQKNDEIKHELEQQRILKDNLFDKYINQAKNSFLFKGKKGSENAVTDSLKSNLAFMYKGMPFFYSNDDLSQVKNSDADALNTAGGISGLSNSYNGEGINFTVFDGGRVYAAHEAFGNATGRIINKEDSSQNYSGHSTAVAGIIGGKNFHLNAYDDDGNIIKSGNAQGMAVNSTINSYRYATTVLPGNTQPKSVFEKILESAPNISNHSYGINSGWHYGYASNGYPQNGWYWTGGYFSDHDSYYDFQGTYFQDDKNYDWLVYNDPSMIIVKSAGNYFGLGPQNFTAYYSNGSGYVAFPSTATLPPANCSRGYDCIGPGSLAKNIIVVGATDIITTNNYKYSNPSDVVRSGYSSAGPRDDGGIKPDIAGVGTGLFVASTAGDTTGSTSWSYGSGTSYSAPQVSGIIGLWIQINKELFSGELLNASRAKTLLIHSALEAGNTGPDVLYGWGFANAKKGAEILLGKANNTIIFEDETLTTGTANERYVKADGSMPLKVTISWVDPEYNFVANEVEDVHNNRVSRLVNDLDIRVIDTVDNTIYYPWKLDINNPLLPAVKGDNTVDNVEQIIIDAPVSNRTYRIEVSNKGTLIDDSGLSASQDYSIIVSGYKTGNLGIQDIIKKSDVAVVPAITKNNINVINVSLGDLISVYDSAGRLLLEKKAENNNQYINVENFTAGVYILKIKTKNGILTKKIIKE